MYLHHHIAVVCPCHNEAKRVEAFLATLPEWVDTIIPVDDASTDDTRRVLLALAERHPRIKPVLLDANRGVGGATCAGFARALELGADIVVKMDGDGQMDPAHLPALLAGLTESEVDYAKGNRFVHRDELKQMPPLRRFGNLGLSLLTKAASGYWHLFDPQNGYLAIRRDALAALDLNALHRGFFFENDMLVQLNIIDAMVRDVAMPAKYGDEESKLRIRRVLREFPPLLVRRLFYRLWRKYFVADFGAISLLIAFGLVSLAFGVGFGVNAWREASEGGVFTSAGRVWLAGLPTMLGIQALGLAFVLEVEESRRLTGTRKSWRKP